jgi:hypothetical protein
MLNTFPFLIHILSLNYPSKQLLELLQSLNCAVRFLESGDALRPKGGKCLGLSL